MTDAAGHEGRQRPCRRRRRTQKNPAVAGRAMCDVGREGEGDAATCSIYLELYVGTTGAITR